MKKSSPSGVSVSTATQNSTLLKSRSHVLIYLFRGEFVMIRGPSGGGKTTMLNLIGTIDSSTSGELLIMGQKIDKDSSDDFLSQLRLKHIGFVF